MYQNIARDISWLSFNERVLQEANDSNVSLAQKIKFLGIYSNNLDEFYRVRVAALRNMVTFGSNAKMHLEKNPQKILLEINKIILKQQTLFEQIWVDCKLKLNEQKIKILNHHKLNDEQILFIEKYFDEEIDSAIVPLMVENLKIFPTLNDKSLYLACVLETNQPRKKHIYALVSIPTRRLSRFVLLPSKNGEQCLILLEDIIKFSLPKIFSYFNVISTKGNIFKVTRDADFSLDNDVTTNFIQKLEKGLKNRKKGKPIRFIYDKDIDTSVLNFLMKKLGMTNADSIISGGKIHNFKDFINFPFHIIKEKIYKLNPIVHPKLIDNKNIFEAIKTKDILLHFPYHSFNSVIALLRQAAIDPNVTTIKISCYRLASRSKIILALTNAVRNGKIVIVVLELRARFDEEANLDWKHELEEAGVKVLMGVPNMKVHSKICVIRRLVKGKEFLYGFVGTGNLNENTAAIYSDFMLITANQQKLKEINKIFNYLERPKTSIYLLKQTTQLLISPTNQRDKLIDLIKEETENAKKKKEAHIILKMNSLSDEIIIKQLYEAAEAGVKLELIIRGIFCMVTNHKKFKIMPKAISIVDEYLEHSRVFWFHNKGNAKVYISSADCMLRNLDHRIEIGITIEDILIKKSIFDILQLQLNDNVKARILDNKLTNTYQKNNTNNKKIRSQLETYHYLNKLK